MAAPQGSAPEGAPKHVFRSKNFSYAFFPWSPNFSNWYTSDSPEARRFDTWGKALGDIHSIILHSDQAYERAGEIYRASYYLWQWEMSTLWSKVSDWQKEMEDLETRVRIADNREMFKNLGISPELLWTPPGYVEEAGAQ